MEYQKYILRDPTICGGQPVIKGTRVKSANCVMKIKLDENVPSTLVNDLIRLHNPGRRVLKRLITHIFENEDVESWRKCFVVVTDSKIRIKRP